MAGLGVSNASELEAAARDLKDSWTKPVAETPPPEEKPPVETPPATPAEQTPPPEVPPAPPTPEEFIEALLREAEGDTPAEILKIPANARIPHKVNGEIVYRPAKEALTSSMREQDYIEKTTEVANSRRELENHAARLIADRARLDAREKFIKEERTRLRDAQKSPEAWERYQNHLRLMEEDPEYAKTFEDAQEARERRAEDVANEAEARQDVIREGVQQAADWILAIGEEPKYRGVDLDRVREVYAASLERGVAQLDERDVRTIFEREAQYLTSSLTPLQAEVAELKAQVAKLSGTDPATAHNRTTQHAIDRAKLPTVNTGQPAAPGAKSQKVAPFTPSQWPDVNAEWNRRR